MKFKTLLLLVFIPFLKSFSQDKTVENFEKAIEDGYINSPTLIPISVSHNNEKKYFLSDTESLYYATEIEFNQKNIDSLKSIILRNFNTQNFRFNNLKSLEIISFSNSKNINEKELKKISQIIPRKKIIAGLIKLSKQQKINSSAYDKYYSERLVIKNKILQNLPNLNEDEKKFLEYLAINITTDNEDIKHMGMWAEFNTANQIFNLWNESIKKEKINYGNLEELEKKLIEKYVTIPKKKYGVIYIIALFKYGVNFYISDLNGTTYFGGIID